MIMIVVLTQTTSLLNHLKPLLCYVMLFPPDNRKHVIIMTFRPSNERGRGRTDYHAGQILIPNRPGWRPGSQSSNNNIIFQAILTALADATNDQSMPCHEPRTCAANGSGTPDARLYMRRQ